MDAKQLTLASFKTLSYLVNDISTFFLAIALHSLKRNVLQ